MTEDMTDRERVQAIMRSLHDLRAARLGECASGPGVDNTADVTREVVCAWVLQSTRAAERAWLEAHAATLMTHYAIALLHALSTAADDATLCEACGWRWQMAVRARAVGIAAAWEERWGERR